MTKKTKPYRGCIDDWWIFYPSPEFKPEDKSLDYIICGQFIDHPHFAGKVGHTSYVVLHNHETGQIETLNSRYTVIGPPKRSPRHEGVYNYDD